MPQLSAEKPILKVLFIANGYPSPLRKWKCPFNHRLVLNLKKHCNVRVLAVRMWLPWRSSKTYTFDNVKVDQLLIPIFCPYIYKCDNKIFLNIYKKLCYKFITYQINQRIKDVDIVHSVSCNPHSFAALYSSIKFRIPFICQLIGSDVTRISISDGNSTLFRKWCSQVDIFISNSFSLQNKFKSFFRKNTINIKSLYRGVDLKKYSPRNNNYSSLNSSLKFLYLGGLINKKWKTKTNNKGAKTLLEAWRIIDENLTNDVSLTIAGPLISSSFFADYQSSLNFPKNINCLFDIPSDDISKLLNTFHVIIIPSYNEGLPNVLLEAMSCGLAVIASDVGGISEVLRDGIDGFLVPPKNKKALVSKMHFFINNKTAASQMGASGRFLMVNNFDSKKYTSSILEIYNELFQK